MCQRENMKRTEYKEEVPMLSALHVKIKKDVEKTSSSPFLVFTQWALYQMNWTTTSLQVNQTHELTCFKIPMIFVIYLWVPSYTHNTLNWMNLFIHNTSCVSSLDDWLEKITYLQRTVLCLFKHVCIYEFLLAILLMCVDDFACMLWKTFRWLACVIRLDTLNPKYKPKR